MLCRDVHGNAADSDANAVLLGRSPTKGLFGLTDRRGDRGKGRRRRGRHQQDLADAPPLRVLGKAPGNGQVYSRNLGLFSYWVILI